MKKREVPKPKREKEFWLILIFIAALAFRLFFALRTSGFTGDDSYFNLRQIESIKKSGMPILHDNLSYSGRTFAFLPGMHYLLAGISFIFSRFISNEILFKIVLNFFAATAAIIAYMIIFELSHNRNAGLVAAFATAFSPIFLNSTINSISTFSISIPLNLLLVYFFIKSEYDMRAVTRFMAVLILASFTDSLVMILLIGIIFYILMISTEDMPESPSRLELVIFSIIFVFWVNFIVFKSAFLTHGVGMIWRNIPSAISSQYFFRINIINIIYRINVIPFIAGIYVLYNYTIREKKKNIYIFAGIIFVLLMMLWLKLVEFWIGLMLISVFFALLLGYFCHSLSSYLAKTKIAGKLEGIAAVFISLLIVSTVASAWQYANSASADSLSQNQEEALNFLAEVQSEEAVISAPESGMPIEYFSKKKTVMDSEFLMIPNINERYADIKTLYQTPYETKALEIMDKYDADIIYLSDTEREEFSIISLKFVGDEKCFELLYNNSVMIYRKLCRLGTAG